MKGLKSLLRAGLVAACAFACAAQAATSITLSGQPGDYILGGQQRSFGAADGTYTVSAATDSVFISFFQSGSAFWNLNFANANGAPLGAGTYERARRIPAVSPGHPGLDVNGEGRGCNQTTGRFIVREIERATDGSIVKFAADFEQHCEGLSRALFGGVRINSDVPYVALTPITQGASFLQLAGQPGDYVLGGQQRTITEADMPFIARTDNGRDVYIDFVGANGWTLGFDAADGAPLSEGTFPDAQRWRFNAAGHPGLDVSGEGRGCNTLTGNFIVRELVRDDDGWIERFAADFEQHCDGSMPALIGGVRINSDVPYPVPEAVTPPSVQDMWWSGPAENGWGMSIVQHGDKLFSVIYAYDSNGNPTWYVVPSGTWNADATAFTGAVYLPHGTPYYAYDAGQFIPGAAVGNVTLTFSDADHAVLAYTINGVSGSKAIGRQSFGSVAAFTPGRGDMWWGGINQNGWGVAILQQYNTLFGVWYTYDANGSPTWFVMPAGKWTDSNTYEGRAYRTTGSPWVGHAYDPAQLQVFDIGPFKFRFNGDNVSLDYNVNGRTGSLFLDRQGF